MAKLTEDDYFSGSAMTFGEHLEELRGALVRAVIALFIGFLVGLYMADGVVRFIEIPLVRAMNKYYLELELDRLTAEFGDEAADEMREFLATNEFIRQNELAFTYQWLEASEARRLLQEYQRQRDAAPQASSEADTQADTQAAAEPETQAGTINIAEPDSPQVDESQFYRIRTWVRKRSVATSLSPQEAFMIWMKAGFVMGAILASPVIFYFIWNFVAAGLYPHEQRYVYLYLPFSVLLFLAGASMAFFFVFDPVLDFLFSFNRAMNIAPETRISEWISFVLLLPLGFGIAFQLPLVMLFINRIGVIELSTFTEKWRLAVLGIFIISMVLTPADPISMLLMAVPLTVLYFGGILLCKFMPRPRNPFETA